LYILIIVLVLVVGVFVVRPMLAKKPAAPARAATAARGRKAADTSAVAARAAKGKSKVPATRGAKVKSDTGVVAAKPTKAAKGKAKVQAAKGKAAKGGVAQPATPQVAAQPEAAPAPRDTTPLFWQSDPFVRDWMLAGELRDMKVRAVTLGARPLALINDRIVSLNDTISGKRVAAITRDSVVFEFGGQRRSLKIGE
jgi:hypothetical protein